jgi:ketosteroid isomerase-like protein
MSIPTSTAQAATNEQVLRGAYEAFSTGDMATFTSYLDPKVVWTMPGKGVLAGEHRGIDGVTAFLGKVMEPTAGSWRVNVTHILTDDEGGAYVTRDSGDRDGKHIEADLVLHVTIRDGKWTDVREFIHDLRAWDDFWS